MNIFFFYFHRFPEHYGAPAKEFDLNFLSTVLKVKASPEALLGTKGSEE